MPEGGGRSTPTAPLFTTPGGLGDPARSAATRPSGPRRSRLSLTTLRSRPSWGAGGGGAGTGFRPADPRQAPAGLVSAANGGRTHGQPGQRPRTSRAERSVCSPAIQVGRRRLGPQAGQTSCSLSDNSGSLEPRRRLLDHAKAGRQDQSFLTGRVDPATTRSAPPLKQVLCTRRRAWSPIAPNGGATARQGCRRPSISIRPDDGLALRQAVLDGVAVCGEDGPTRNASRRGRVC
jgi:hypothetical protein